MLSAETEGLSRTFAEVLISDASSPCFAYLQAERSLLEKVMNRAFRPFKEPVARVGDSDSGSRVASDLTTSRHPLPYIYF